MLHENVKLSTNFTKITVKSYRDVFVIHESTQLCKCSALAYCFV